MTQRTATLVLFGLTLAFLAMGSLPAAAFTCLAMVAVGLMEREVER